MEDAAFDWLNDPAAEASPERERLLTPPKSPARTASFTPINPALRKPPPVVADKPPAAKSPPDPLYVRGDDGQVKPEQTGTSRPGKAVPPSGPGLAKTFHLQFDHVDAMGAFFRFSPALLRDETFRLIFPRQCLICGQQRSLLVHLVDWTSQSHRAQKRIDEHRSVLRLDQLADADGAHLLKHLPRLEHLDEPYNLPMPYYVCTSCSNVGALMSVVQPAPDGVGDDCVLGIASLAQAEAFAQAARGHDWSPLTEIRAWRERHADPWSSLPLAIRIRLGQWYKAQPGEQFQLYVWDMEFSRAEAGLAGLIATDRRLLHRRGPALTDLPYSKRITLQFKKITEEVVDLHVRADEKTIRIQAMDAHVKQLREILAKFRHA